MRPNPQALWLCVLAATPLLAQVADGVIEGAVRDRLTGQPVAGATVSLFGGQGRRPVESAAAGSFRFTELRPGSYQVSVRKPGYVDSSYGEGRSAPLAVKPGGAPVAVTIDLTPTGALEGRVTGEDGKPLGGAAVYVSRSRSPAISADTDGEGSFLVENLAPGEHRVEIRLPFEVRHDTARRDPERGEVWAYPAFARHASPVEVPPAARVSGFQIDLRRERVVDVKGRLIDGSGGGPLNTARVELSGAGSATGGAFAPRPVDRDGRFELPLVEPGQYRLLVHYAGESNRWPYVLPLDVAPRAAGEEQTWRVPAPVRVEGKVVRPEHSTTPLTGLTLMVAQVDVRSSAHEVKPLDDGTFALDNMPPGDLFVAARWTGDHPPGWYVESIRLGGQEGLNGPLRVGEAGNPPLEIVLGDNGGRISGRLAGAQDSALPPPVMLRRIARGMRFDMTLVIVRAQPGGAFSADGLTPGEYELQAMGCAEAKRVRVERGATAAVQVEPCR